MAVPRLKAREQYTSVRPTSRSGLVHAVALFSSTDGQTACGRMTSGWVAAMTERISCHRCLEQLFYRVRRGAGSRR